MGRFRDDIEGISGYTPGTQPRGGGWIKLNTNENPYPPSPKALEAGREALANLQLYPDPVSRRLREAAARAWGVAPQEVIAGNGSDDILTILVRATVGEGETLATFAPSYSLYRTLAQIQGARYREIPFTEDYAIPADLDLAGVRLLFLANPNSPSGTAVGHEAIARVCAACAGVVVVDEAYADFARTNALPLLRECPNLVITRTLSKSYGLAGLRVGFGIAGADVVAELMKVKDSYNLDRVAQAAATAALEDAGHLAASVARIRATRERLAAGLHELGVATYPSEANFVFARFTRPAAKEVFAALEERKILVRHFDAPRTADCLRITVGSEEETGALLEALGAILGG
jgi:histidinol-phosphate aminotransferase